MTISSSSTPQDSISIPPTSPIRWAFPIGPNWRSNSLKSFWRRRRSSGVRSLMARMHAWRRSYPLTMLQCTNTIKRGDLSSLMMKGKWVRGPPRFSPEHPRLLLLAGILSSVNIRMKCSQNTASVLKKFLIFGLQERLCATTRNHSYNLPSRNRRAAA